MAGEGLILRVVTETVQATAPPLRSDLATLVKARLNTFVLITAFFGFFVAVRSRGGWVTGDWLLMFHTMVGTAAAAFGASVFNQLMEIREDARMRRTSNRPLPARRVLPFSAFILGSLLAAFGVVHLSVMVNKPAALLAAVTIGFYVFVYTPMKRRSSLNTLAGAVPGALPPLIGWVAGGGGMADPRGWYLFAVLFLWQLPHFVAINWLCREQYEEAGFVMWSDGDESGRRSARLAALFSAGLAGLTVVAPLAAFTGWVFGVTGALAGAGLALMALRFAASGERRAFRQFFLLTLLYLPVVFTVLAVDWK